MGEREPLYTVGGYINCKHRGKQYGGFSKKQKIELPHDPANSTSGYTLKKKNPKYKFKRIYMLPMFIAAYLQLPDMEATKSWLESQHSKN